MRLLKILIAFGIVMLMVGCVPSIHPLFTEKELIYDSTLEGNWVNKDGKTSWVLLKSKEGNYYDVICIEDGVPAKFEAHLVKVGEFTFIDLYPKEIESKNTYLNIHLMAIHTFVKIQKKEDILEYSALDPEWLKKMINEKKIKIAHERVNDGIILTASPAELQKFVLKYAKDDKAFYYKTELHRPK